MGWAAGFVSGWIPLLVNTLPGRYRVRPSRKREGEESHDFTSPPGRSDAVAAGWGAPCPQRFLLLACYSEHSRS